MTQTNNAEEWLDQIKWDDKGLVAAIAQDYKTKQVLMMAWMNRESLKLSVEESRAVYWSRSRNRLWRKGEESGNVQYLKDIYLDCDGDALVIEVEQIGDIACHTGRRSCFYRKLEKGAWSEASTPIKTPEEMYKK